MSQSKLIIDTNHVRVLSSYCQPRLGRHDLDKEGTPQDHIRVQHKYVLLLRSNMLQKQEEIK